ncbi:spore maturation protein cgeB [Paenibacillus beijingensis]|uniref:Spore maturation protein cgeB n=1 Tax=Paenibacillus beijingensis TaxID=1126833 RepID=A0A0D5NR94_9BACL|nr:spore maturation protein cgeB [Paenibacillus beijingensis]
MRNLTAHRSAIARGRTDGYLTGWDHGVWYGKCEAVIRSIKDEIRHFPVHIMFVATGKGFPYSPLDTAVAESLKGMVGRLSLTNALQPVAQQAASLRPDAVIVLDGLQFPTKQVDAIRALGIKTAVWFTDDPYYTDVTKNLAPHYDYVFTLEKQCVEFYMRNGCVNVHYLPFAAYLNDFRPRNPPLSLRKEISFIGSAYWKRVEFFNQISNYLAMRDISISGLWWERLRHFNLLKSKIKPGHWMGPLETAEAYNASKIVINMHRAHDDDSYNSNKEHIAAVSPNPRTFEISACATLQLTDIRDDLASFYTPGVELVTYSSPSEMIEKIEYYLHHEEERREIAMRGMYRTMREHTYPRRLEQMLSVMLA